MKAKILWDNCISQRCFCNWSIEVLKFEATTGGPKITQKKQISEILFAEGSGQTVLTGESIWVLTPRIEMENNSAIFPRRRKLLISPPVKCLCSLQILTYPAPKGLTLTSKWGSQVIEHPKLSFPALSALQRTSFNIWRYLAKLRIDSRFILSPELLICSFSNTCIFELLHFAGVF